MPLYNPIFQVVNKDGEKPYIETQIGGEIHVLPKEILDDFLYIKDQELIKSLNKEISDLEREIVESEISLHLKDANIEKLKAAICVLAGVDSEELFND